MVTFPLFSIGSIVAICGQNDCYREVLLLMLSIAIALKPKPLNPKY